MKILLTFFLQVVLISTFVNGQTLSSRPTVGPRQAKNISDNSILHGIAGKHQLIQQVNTRQLHTNGLKQIHKVDKIPVNSLAAGLKSINTVDSVVFMRPSGYFFPSFTTDYNYMDYYFLFGPAYTKSNWRNFSDNASSYLWTLPDPDGEEDEYFNVNATITSTEKEPEVSYPNAVFYSTPSLTASDNSNSLTYNWGGVDSTYVLAGGSIESLMETGVCNYDYHQNMYAYYFEEGDYLFGSGPDSIVDAIANYFEKPDHKYVLDSLWINATYCTAPAGTEFEIIIHRVDDNGDLADTIATASTTIENVLGPFGNSNTYYTLVFSAFDVFDEELGFEVTQDYLEIEDGIVVELKGFNNVNGIDFSVMEQEIGTSPVNESNAYLYYIVNGVRNFGSYNFGSTSLSFNLGIIYSYLFADDSEFAVPETGGSKTFDVTCYYSPESIWLEEELPEWLSLDYTFDETTWENLMTLTAEALPSDVNGRSATINIGTYGSNFSIKVTQGEPSGILDDNIAKTNVINREGILSLTYPSVYNSLVMYNLSGQIIGRYNLPETGYFSFKPLVSNNALYILKLSGESNYTETIKVAY